MITLLMPVRVEGNKSHNIERLFDSMAMQTNHPENLEVLIKYDDDDSLFQEWWADDYGEKSKYPFKTKCYSGPRGNGYYDLHLYCTYLMQFVNPRTNIIGWCADDFKLRIKGWDDIISNAAKGKTLFIIHGKKYDYDISDLSHAPVDEAPFWSKELLYTIGFWPVFATDAWTLVLEYYLQKNHGVDITTCFYDHLYERFVDTRIDGCEGPRWNNERKRVFEFMDGEYFRTIVQHQAANIVRRMKG